MKYQVHAMLDLSNKGARYAVLYKDGKLDIWST